MIETGKIGVRSKDVWRSDTDYMIADIVTSPNGNAAYISRKPVPAGTSLDNTEYWDLLISVPSASSEPHNYALDGANLKTVFGTASAFHAALAAEDYSNIRVGDYWQISLTGNYRDYGIGSAAGEYEQKSFSNATVILEVAAINPYWKYGDSGNIANGTPHVLFISRDCLPTMLKMRKENTLWEDESSQNPWLGSALYRTLNDPNYGIVNLVSGTDIGAYIYGGADGNGMRYFGEIRSSPEATTSGGAMFSRGKLFLPTEDEIWGREIFTVRAYHGQKGLPIFDGTRRHILKGIGNGGSKYTYFTMSALSGSSTNMCVVSVNGFPDESGSANAYGVPLCFLVT